MFQQSDTKCFYISGVRDISGEEFAANYPPRIRALNAADPSCRFVVGNEPGTDQFAQAFLRELGVAPDHITIFYRGEPPANPYNYHTVEVTDSLTYNHLLTVNSSHDIAWARPPPGEGNNGSDTVQRNLARRKQMINTARRIAPVPRPGAVYVPPKSLPPAPPRLYHWPTRPSV